jgi:hypothetical protein
MTHPVESGAIGTITLKQVDGSFMHGSFDLTQAFEDGSQSLWAVERFVVPYQRPVSSPLPINKPHRIECGYFRFGAKSGSGKNR